MEVTAANAASLSNKLTQMANGAVYSDDGAVVHLHDQKLDALEDILEAANGEPVLVAYWFQHDLKRIKERLIGLKVNARVLKTEVDIRDWNAGKLPWAYFTQLVVVMVLTFKRWASLSLVWIDLVTRTLPTNQCTTLATRTTI